jgi:hypothetical protein
MAAFKFICFSDIDGTLVHYVSEPKDLAEVRGVMLELGQLARSARTTPPCCRRLCATAAACALRAVAYNTADTARA